MTLLYRRHITLEDEYFQWFLVFWRAYVFRYCVWQLPLIWFSDIHLFSCFWKSGCFEWVLNELSRRIKVPKIISHSLKFSLAISDFGPNIAPLKQCICRHTHTGVYLYPFNFKVLSLRAQFWPSNFWYVKSLTPNIQKYFNLNQQLLLEPVNSLSCTVRNSWFGSPGRWGVTAPGCYTGEMRNNPNSCQVAESSSQHSWCVVNKAPQIFGGDLLLINS